MSTLFLFNPENDLALAQGSKSYTPPPLARAIARDLSALPLWYATPLSAVWLPVAGFAEPLRPVLSALGVGCETVVAGKFPSTMTACSVWGWSHEVVARLSRAGVPAALLPDDARLARQRELAHRLHTRNILLFLSEQGIDVPPELPVRLVDEIEVKNFVERHRQAVLKAPWSGSGKGLCWTQGLYDLSVGRWAQGVLRRQGEIVGECYYPKVADFAMEFYSDGRSVDFAGYSFFETDSRGAYRGNWLASDTAIETRLAGCVGREILLRVRQLLADYFTRSVALVYKGYFGVDMLIYRTEQGYALHPCVELNLRMNMGVVSRLFYDRYVSEGCEGIYRVEYFADPRLLAIRHEEQYNSAPLHVVDGKITRGYLSLCPVYSDTRYRAFVEIKSSR